MTATAANILRNENCSAFMPSILLPTRWTTFAGGTPTPQRVPPGGPDLPQLRAELFVFVLDTAAVGGGVVVDVVPAVVERQVAAFAFARVVGGDIRGQRDHRIAQGDFGPATRLAGGIVADAPGPVLDLLGIAAADGAEIGGRFGQRGALAAGLRVERGAALVVLHADLRP